MGSTRIKGAALKLTIGTTDYWADVTAVTLNNEEAAAGVVTFEDASLGGSRQFFLEGSAIQSTDATSLWSYIWDNTGDIVSYVYAPHGNTTPSASEPHFEGTIKVPAKPAVGGEAAINGEYTFDFRFDCQEEPTKVIA
jgi:hypothetical protein